MSKGKQKRVFVISPIGAEGSETRVWFDKVLRHIIEPACKKFAYSCVRADTLPRPGTITSQITDCLREYELAITDLTDLNPNVFYELAIRHATNLPVILIARKGTRIPFDINAERVVYYTLDPDDILASISQLEKLITTVESSEYENESPLKAKIQIETTKNLSDKEFMENIYTMINELRNEILIQNKQKNEVPQLVLDFIKQSDRFHAEKLRSNEFRVGGVGIVAGRSVDIYFDKVDSDHYLNTFKANADGTWTGILKIPSGIIPGTHYLWMKDRETGISVNSEISL